MRWLIALVSAAAVWGCSVPVGSEAGRSDSEIPGGKGLLVFHWPSGAERAALESGWASSVADVYEAALFSPARSLGFALGIGSGEAVAVDPGTYRVLVLAGVKKSSGSSTAYLVGSANAEGVTVTAGTRTTVDLVLRPIELAWETASPAVWKTAVAVKVSGGTRNSRLGMSLAGASTALRPRFKSADLWGGYKEMSSVTGTPDLWAAEAAGTTPSSGAAFSVELVGASLVTLGDDGVWAPLAGTLPSSWFWPSRPELADTHPLVALTTSTVPCGPPSTGLDVGLRWE